MNPDIAHVIPGVRRMAHRTPLSQNGAMDADDMAQDAVTGLIGAARTFDPKRGVRFATHAYPRARGALLDGQRAMDHVPRSWRTAQRQALRARTALVAELSREPTPDELAERLGITTQELRDNEERCRRPARLDERLQGQSVEGDQLTVADLLPDDDPLLTTARTALAIAFGHDVRVGRWTFATDGGRHRCNPTRRSSMTFASSSCATAISPTPPLIARRRCWASSRPST